MSENTDNAELRIHAKTKSTKFHLEVFQVFVLSICVFIGYSILALKRYYKNICPSKSLFEIDGKLIENADSAH